MEPPSCRPYGAVPLWAFCGIAIAGAWAPAVAFAQAEVVVLGIRSVEGDDDFARNLTGALRHEASQVEGWSLSDREVTLAQLVLAHGCEEPDPTCMAQIADSLNADLILYGDVRRTSAEDDFDFSIQLRLFERASAGVAASVEDTVPHLHRDIDHLREPAQQYVAALSGEPPLGAVRVAASVPGAEVFIDDEVVGVTDENGVLVLENIPAGSRNVRIEAPGHETYRSTLSVQAYGESELEAALTTRDDSDERGGMSDRDVELVVGATLTGVGVALAGAWIGSWAYLQWWATHDGGVNADWTDARNQFGTDVDDICHGASTVEGDPAPSWVVELCDQRDVLETLPFMFGISAAVIGGVGLYLLISALTGDDTAQPSVVIEPSFGPDYGYVGLRGAF